MAISNPDRVVTKQDLSDFYGQILPYLGGMPEAIANKFSRADLYSTSEKIVGCWVDGRPLYQKTISCGALPNNSTKQINHNISNIKEVINTTGYAKNTSNGTMILIPFVNPTDIVNCVGVNSNTTVTAIVTGSDRSKFNESYVTLQYTKTTDAANSFIYSNETDYSTDEHIVGTWIDGKPIYQRTYSVTIPTRGNRTIIITDETFDRIVNSKTSANKVSGNNRWRFGSDASYRFGANDIAVYVEGNTVYIGNESSTDSYGGGDAYVTLQYTKTTD